jgi:adenosylcobinamide kinase/adenosylcobinamide-phosphate guanylyltransferase
MECGEPVLYVATATALDEEMAERIREHQQRRPQGWRTLEVPVGVAAAVAAGLGAARTVVVEDLTLLLANITDAPEATAIQEVDQLLAVPANLVLVSNEVGMGVVPAYPAGRQFRDRLGRLNQHAAARADEVVLLVAGLPLRLKPSS